ncbi:alpha-N-acetylglucosaminidase C-terminal domain-containing protein, partial [bacterium]|nr:alpha-N-acetylglucosaminidase C-terminal domain-containing protein [bacterium]
AWRDSPVDLAPWMRDYARHRYGRANADADAAWAVLKDTVYTGPSRTHSIVQRAPTLGVHGGAPYDTVRLAQAWKHLLAAAEELGAADTYRFDLVNVARQVLSSHASELHAAVAQAHLAKGRLAKNPKAFSEASERFLQLIRDLDELLASREEFLLGRWLEDAKRWGDTDAERAKLEWNARRVLTLWGSGRNIRDYARKEWAGMLSGFYLKRWQSFFDAAQEEPFDDKAFHAGLLKWESDWTNAREAYPTEPRGDSIAIAQKLWAKYSGAFRPEATSLTTGKPATCSHALPPYPARLANDGRSRSTDHYWATDVAKHRGDAWWQVDLGKPTTVGRVVVVAYYGDKRYYGFTVETSLDGKTWDMAADRRDNKEPATREGVACRFEPQPVRYIRVTQTRNSANTGRHLVEVMAYKE